MIQLDMRISELLKTRDSRNISTIIASIWEEVGGASLSWRNDLLYEYLSRIELRVPWIRNSSRRTPGYSGESIGRSSWSSYAFHWFLNKGLPRSQVRYQNLITIELQPAEKPRFATGSNGSIFLMHFFAVFLGLTFWWTVNLLKLLTFVALPCTMAET